MKIIYILSIVLLFACNSNKSGKATVDIVKDTIQSKSLKKDCQVKIIDPTGTYSLDSETEIRNDDTYGYFGEIQVKRVGDDKIAISFSINKGAPSYNMGGFLDTLRFVNNEAIYRGWEDTPDCKIVLAFSEMGITVEEDKGNACGFGHGVYADGFFKKTSLIAPILENPFTGRRIETKSSIYSKKAKTGVADTVKIPEVYNELFDVVLVGLERQKKGPDKKYSISCSATCMCEVPSILMKRDEKKIYVYPYCKAQPSSEEYNNWEYNIKSIDFIDNKLAVRGICENSDKKELVFIFGMLDNENVFSLEIEGDKPNSMWLEKYITHKERLFEKCECDDYGG